MRTVKDMAKATRDLRVAPLTAKERAAGATGRRRQSKRPLRTAVELFEERVRLVEATSHHGTFVN